MNLTRQDLSTEANIERRKFWEMCASRAPISRLMPLRDLEDQEGVIRRKGEDAAIWADRMLVEWDKRWIKEGEKNKEEEKDNREYYACGYLDAGETIDIIAGPSLYLRDISVFEPDDQGREVVIIRLSDSQVLYRWSNGRWIDGEGQEAESKFMEGYTAFKNRGRI